jgi:hypothetical protein
MQPEIMGSIVGAIIQVFGGAIGGFLIAYFTLVRQRKTRKIEFEKSSISLLESKMVKRSPLSVSVDKSVITGAEKDNEDSILVKTAYAFIVELENVSQEAVHDPCVEIILDDEAMIVGYEYEPEYWPGKQPSRELNSTGKNILRLTFPYINKNDPIKINVISIQNNSSDCKVRVLGPDIYAIPRKQNDEGSFIYLFKKRPEKLIQLAFILITMGFYFYTLFNLDILAQLISLLIPE